MINWIIDTIPVWVWVVLIAIPAVLTINIWLPLFITVWKALPTPVRFILGGFLAALFAYLSGRNRGRQNAREEQARRDAEANRQRLRTDAEIRQMTEEQRERERRRWERD